MLVILLFRFELSCRIAAERPKSTEMPDNNAGSFFLLTILAYTGCLEIITIYESIIF